MEKSLMLRAPEGAGVGCQLPPVVGLRPARPEICADAKFTAPYSFCLSFALPGLEAGRLRIAVE